LAIPISRWRPDELESRREFGLSQPIPPAPVNFRLRSVDSFYRSCCIWNWHCGYRWSL